MAFGDREVLLICGPPGAGKTTLARSSGLTVYDLDDAIWMGSEKAFTASLSQLACDAEARAAVIRSGATKRARQRHAELIRATDVTVLDVEPETCIERVISRDRRHPPIEAQIAAIRKWWRTYQPDGARPRRRDPRDSREWRKLSAQVVSEEPLCWLNLPGCTRVSTTGDHIIPVNQRPDLALVRVNVRGACRRCNGRRQDKPAPNQEGAALGWFA